MSLRQLKRCRPSEEFPRTSREIREQPSLFETRRLICQVESFERQCVRPSLPRSSCQCWPGTIKTLAGRLQPSLDGRTCREWHMHWNCPAHFGMCRSSLYRQSFPLPPQVEWYARRSTGAVRLEMMNCSGDFSATIPGSVRSWKRGRLSVGDGCPAAKDQGSLFPRMA